MQPAGPPAEAERASVARILESVVSFNMSSPTVPLSGGGGPDPAGAGRPDVSVHATGTAAWLGVCALTFAAPFEALKPLVRLPGQSVSSVETVLLAALGLWVATLVWLRVVPRWRTPLTWPWLALLAAMLLAAGAAPVDRLNALNMVGRFALASGVYLLTVNGITSPARLRGALVAAAAAGTVAALLVILEYLGVVPVVEGLGVFRPRLALVGAQVRASGPFQYPTIAAMYLEVVFGFVLAFLPVTIDEARRGGQPWNPRRVGPVVAVGAVLALIAEAIIFTFTRAGLMTMATSLVIVGSLRYRRRGFDRGAQAVAVVAVLIAVLFVTSRSFESLRLRFTTEGMDTWFRASVDAPLHVSLRSGETTTIPVTLRNTGGSTWDSSAPQPFRLSYHWLSADQDHVLSWEGLRTAFPQPVAPGETVSLLARVEAPRHPGEYRLMWDVEQEDRLWFSTEPDALWFVSRATVSGAAVGPGSPTVLMPLPRTAARPGRLVLWRAAGRMLAERPVVGVGPDNFRLQYGPHAGLVNFDRRVHSNNMYVEMLVGGGLLAGLAFAWLCWRGAGIFAAAVRDAMEPALALPAAGLAAAGTAVALHGLVDSFVGFTGTYVLFAITLGLGVACAGLSAGARRSIGGRESFRDTHAHRV